MSIEKKDGADILNFAQACSRCKYCSGVAAPDKTISFICRRYPPIPVGGPVSTNQGLQLFSNTMFPSIGSPKEHWCGEFSPVLN